RERRDRGGHRGRYGSESRNALQRQAIVIFRAVLRGRLPEPEEGATRLDEVAVLQAGLGAGTPVHPGPVGGKRVGDPPLPVAPDEPRVGGGKPRIRHLEAELARTLGTRGESRRSPPEKDGIDPRERVPGSACERTVALQRDDDCRRGFRNRERGAGGAEHRRSSLEVRGGEGKGHRLSLWTSGGRARSLARS